MVLAYQEIPYRSIIPIFQNHREQLKANVRFDRYRLTESPEKFARLLGDDVRFISHPGVTYNHAKDFIDKQNELPQRQRLTLAQQRDLLIAPLIHDLGELKLEGLGVGDITFADHTPEHQAIEQKVFDKLTEFIPERIELRRIYEEIVQNRNTRLGKLFNAIERIGYLKTAMRAYSGHHGERISNWAGLVGNVLSHQIEPLLGYAADYPGVSVVLQQYLPQISQALVEVPSKNLPLDRNGVPSYDEHRLARVAETWTISPVVFAIQS